MWFGEGTRIRIEGETLEVVASSAFAADWIGRHFTDDLRESARTVLPAGTAPKVEIRPPEATRSSPSGPEPKAAERNRADGRADVDRPGGGPPVRRGSSPNGHDHWRRLEDFVPGTVNRLAFEAASRVAEGAEGSDRILFVHGECGVGKTHLLQGACRLRRERSRLQRVRYTTGEQFTNEFIASVRGGSLEGFRRRFRSIDLLAIDDVHFLSNKTATQGEFLHTLDAIALGGATVVLASDEHPRHIARLNRSLVSRFLAGMVVRVELPDRETRRTLLRRLAAKRRLRLSEAAEEALVSRFAGSARELEGGIAKLSVLAALSPSADPAEVGMVLVEQLFEATPDSGGRRPVRLAAIIEVVATRLGVEREEILGRSKQRRASEARAVVVHLARRLTSLSYPEIARGLGRRNHSAIHSAEARVRAARAAGGADGERWCETIDRIAHGLLQGS